MNVLIALALILAGCAAGTLFALAIVSVARFGEDDDV